NLSPNTQTGCGIDYWSPSTPYTSAQVSNPPPACDIVALIGGANQTYIVTLSEAIKDPIMAVLSLGQPNVLTTYDFDSPFDIVSQGTGYWGGTSSSLAELAGDVLQGNEGHGTIQFIGTFNTFSWVVPTPENWHGFTFGIRTTERIEPGPTPVPEPASLLLLVGGLAAGGMRSRYARKRSR
ncbi:MAG: PEP-CTERM sorting domain-containing protein, partial [Vicinamibacterales bacterium]